MFDIEKELKKLPDKPGVYIMRNKDNDIIYVGKAVSLKNRVRQYFRKNNKTARIEKMVSQIYNFEYIVTDNEAEALILECNLIKKNRPKFNVLLKDDKTYPYIKVEVQNDYPNVFITRRYINDGSKYFGPYASAGSAKEMVDFIKSKFKIRQCKKFKSNRRACLNYQIKKCLAPCMNYISKQEYREQIEQIIMLLEGKTEQIIKKIETEIKNASEKFEYEKAAYLRDKLNAIKNITERQKVSNISENNIDVIGLARNEYAICIEIFFVRNSKMIGRDHYFFDNLKDMNNKEILLGFIKQYYIGTPNLPNKIMLQEEIEDKIVIENLLTSLAGRKVMLKTPLKGEKLRFVEMAQRNALITLQNKEKDKITILNELKECLKINFLPRKIEMFDISNISGQYLVGGMCVSQDGIIKKNLSRRFKIKDVQGQDDVKCMEEVLTRRLKHSIENSKGDFGDFPDIIFADGGINQINAIKKAILKYNLNICVFGIVKDSKHVTRALINENRQELNITDNVKNFITNFQNEVHRVAIEYHRKLRDKDISKSELDNIKGVGNIKKQLLLKEFGSVKKIKQASIEEITQIRGINKKLAEEIKKSIE